VSVDSLAGEAAQRAVELRSLSDKGARPRKKKALTDFLSALRSTGLSARRSAVPALERNVHAWFSQVGCSSLQDCRPALYLHAC
jgi:midasin